MPNIEVYSLKSLKFHYFSKVRQFFATELPFSILITGKNL